MPPIILALSRNIKLMMWTNTLCLTLVIPSFLIFFNNQDLRMAGMTASMGLLLGAGSHLFFNNFRLRKARLELISSFEKVRNDLFFDDLTGLYNRRAGMERLREEFARACRNGKEFSVAMVDVDHFKKVNDTYGHLAGDHVLKEIGKILRTELRQCDVIVRYGGEEFMVIMPETDQKQAIQALERLCSKLSSMEISYGDLKIKITISIGVASAFPVMKDPMGVIHRADEALYRAKRSGRNRVILNEQMPRLSFASVN